MRLCWSRKRSLLFTQFSLCRLIILKLKNILPILPESLLFRCSLILFKYALWLMFYASQNLIQSFYTFLKVLQWHPMLYYWGYRSVGLYLVYCATYLRDFAIISVCHSESNSLLPAWIIALFKLFSAMLILHNHSWILL